MQGCIKFSAPHTFSWVTTHIFGDGTHIEICRSWKASVKYCKKDSSRAPGTAPIEIGNPRYAVVSSGYRSDLADVVDDIYAGSSLRELTFQHLPTFIRYHGGITRALGILRQPSATERFVHVIHGDPGTGKTRSVFDRHGYDNVFNWDGSGWFDGYEGQDVILADEMEYDVVTRQLASKPLSWWNKFLDRYPMRLQVKGGYVLHEAKAVYLTTNQDPKNDWWLGYPDNMINAFWRRIDTIKKF